LAYSTLNITPWSTLWNNLCNGIVITRERERETKTKNDDFQYCCFGGMLLFLLHFLGVLNRQCGECGSSRCRKNVLLRPNSNILSISTTKNLNDKINWLSKLLQSWNIYTFFLINTRLLNYSFEQIIWKIINYIPSG